MHRIAAFNIFMTSLKKRINQNRCHRSKSYMITGQCVNEFNEIQTHTHRCGNDIAATLNKAEYKFSLEPFQLRMWSNCVEYKF